MVLRIILQLCSAMLFTSLTSQAQKGMNLQDHMLIKESDKYLYGGPEADYEGSPYFNDDFIVGYVYTGMQKFNGVRMRYNIFQDLIEFQDLGVNYVLQPDARIKKVEIGDETLVVGYFKVLSKNLPGFLQVIESGNLTLLARKNISFREKILISDVPAKYIRGQDSYFYKIDNKDFMKVGNVKSFISSLPNKQEEVSRFIKLEKISTQDKDDLVKLVKFYNSLVSGQ